MSSPSKGKYKCTHEGCSERFRREKHLDSHVYKHTGIKTYKCPKEDCDAKFIIRDHLQRHEDTVHGFGVEKVEVPCKHPDCSNTYSSHDNMMKHYKRIHLHAKTHDCPECGESYMKKAALNIHMYSHTGKYPQTCVLCQEGFLNLKALQKHQTLKHKNGNEKVCEFCHLKFSNWTDMVAHKKETHKARKTFECDECPELVFYSKAKLKRHMTSHENKDRVLCCEQEGCTYTTDSRNRLHGHIRRVHGEKNYKCDECGACFHQMSGVSKHKRAMHTNPRPNAVPRKLRKDAGVPKTSVIEMLLGSAVVQLDAQEKAKIDAMYGEKRIEEQEPMDAESEDSCWDLGIPSKPPTTIAKVLTESLAQFEEEQKKSATRDPLSCGREDIGYTTDTTDSESVGSVRHGGFAF